MIMDPELFFNRTVFATHPCYKLLNGSSIFLANPAVMCALLYTFLGSLSVITVCGNLLVITSIMYFRQLHTPNNYLVLSLAVADLLVGVLVFPFSMIVTVTSCWYHENMLCKVRGIFDVTLSTASILNLCCISIDRYYAVCKPLTYKSKMNYGIIRMMILGCWGVAALIGIGIVAAGFNQGKCEGSCSFDALISTTLACIFSFYIPVLMMLSIYLKIFLVARSQVNTILSRSCQTKTTGAPVSKVERKATKTLAVVMGVFILCWSPYFLCIVFQPIAYDVTPAVVIETLNWLTLSNSMLNPFIYAFFYSWFRTAVSLMISGKIFQGDLTHSNLF